MLLHAIDAAERGAPPASARYCDGPWATTSADMSECAADDVVRRDYAASRDRTAALDVLGGDPRVETLRKAFFAYSRMEIDRRWLSFLGGSGGISGLCAFSLEGALHEAHDEILRRLARLAPAPEASSAELQTAARDLASAEREAGSREFRETLTALHDRGTADAYTKRLAESGRRFRELETLVAAGARDRLGVGAARALRIDLRRLRIDALATCPG